MKRILTAMASLCVIAVFSGCGNGESSYTPDPSSHYFKTGNVYRVIELTSEQPEHDEGYALHSLTPIPVNNKLFTSYTVQSTFSFANNTLFFDDINALNKDGVVAVYDYLDITSTPLADELFECDLTGLNTYNTRYQGATVKITMEDYDQYPEYSVVGIIAEVDIYTFNYRDLSVKNGKEMASGTFSVILSGAQYFDCFVCK